MTLGNIRKNIIKKYQMMRGSRESLIMDTGTKNRNESSSGDIRISNNKVG